MIDQELLCDWLEKQIQNSPRHRLSYRRLLSMIQNSVFDAEFEQ